MDASVRHEDSTADGYLWLVVPGNSCFIDLCLSLCDTSGGEYPARLGSWS